MAKKKLTLRNFRRFKSRDSLGHCFTHKLKDGGKICLESCMNGYCVARYNKNLELVEEKICTNMEHLDLMTFFDSFPSIPVEALAKAIEIANSLYEEIHRLEKTTPITT